MKEMIPATAGTAASHNEVSVESARRLGRALSIVPLALLALSACGSPTAPKFPPPVEEPDTTEQEGEGATGRRPVRSLPALHLELQDAGKAACTETNQCKQ
jgi:hypothetical protein